MITKTERRHSMASCPVFVMCTLVLTLAVRAASSATQRAQVTFSITKPTVTLHEPIYLEFAARNESRQKLVLYLGHNFKTNFRFVIIDPQGRKHVTKPIAAEGFGATGEISAAPGKTYTLALVLNEWYRFGGVGAYQIDAELLSAPPPFEKGSTTTWRSAPLYIKVLPRDPNRLKETCNRLANAALSSAGSNEGAYAALGLSYVQDTVALPYLARLLSRGGMVSFSAIQGLVRIDTPRAVQILKSNLKTQNPLLRSQIQGALTEIITGRHPTVAD